MVRVRDGKVVDSFDSLIQPPAPFDFFNDFNTKLHGIGYPEMEGAPTWPEALAAMLEFIGDDILVAHNAQFDMDVLRKTAEHSGIKLPELKYACSLLISRKVYNLESYRLNAVAYRVGIEEFDHHQALADADTCAKIIIHATNHKDVETLEELVAATKQTIKSI